MYYTSPDEDLLKEAAQAKDVIARMEEVQRQLCALKKENRKHREYVRSLQASLAAPATQQVITLSSSDWRKTSKGAEEEEAMEEELKKLAAQLAEHESKRSNKERLAKDYREVTSQLLHSLLPHKWLWEADELGIRQLRDPILKSELRWEREFNELHVVALYHWMMRFVHDPQQTPYALELLGHIREHYWPADAGLLGKWLQLKLREAAADKEQAKAYEHEALKANPTVAYYEFPRFESLGFTDEEQIAVLTQAIEFDAENPMLPALREHLARIYGAIAAKLEGSAGVGKEDALENALASAVKAHELTGKSSYSAQVSTLGKMLEDLRRGEKLEQEIAERFGADARLLRLVERPLLVEYSEDLEDEFRAGGEPGENKQGDRSQILQLLNDGLFYELGVHFPSVECRRSSNPAAKNHYEIWPMGRTVGGRRTSHGSMAVWSVARSPEDGGAGG
jgi:hypothetical protein